MEKAAFLLSNMEILPNLNSYKPLRQACRDSKQMNRCRQNSNDIIIRAYIENFGQKKDDYCLVADLNGLIIGAVWVRILADEIKGYGNVDDKTPEFAISLFKEYRKQERLYNVAEIKPETINKTDRLKYD